MSNEGNNQLHKSLYWILKHKNMIDKNDIMKFDCNFTDAPRFDRIFVWSECTVLMFILIICRQKDNIYPFLFFGLLFMLIPLWFEFSVHMVRTKSYIELIDNKIVFKGWMCRKASFPIDKIESVRVVDFDTDVVDKLTRDYRLPVAMGRVNLYPQKGVIIFFERKWIKSVQPILFNPIDPEQFAHALAVKSGKVLS
ncbi:MAG: hypothetical protein K2G52_01085 [Muribaculaceae bacterium]|nr:hypothetical protein [Muribaculaceae bacterium]